jgi:hypothetical protein
VAQFALVTADVKAGADFLAIPDTVDPAKLREELATIAGELGQLFTHPLGLPLKTLEVDLTITAEGSIGFLGNGGKLTGEGSIKLTFEQPAAK